MGRGGDATASPREAKKPDEPLKVYLHKYRETEGEKATNARQGDTPKNGKNNSGGDAQGTLGGNQNSAGYGQVF